MNSSKHSAARKCLLSISFVFLHFVFPSSLPFRSLASFLSSHLSFLFFPHPNLSLRFSSFISAFYLIFFFSSPFLSFLYLLSHFCSSLYFSLLRFPHSCFLSPTHLFLTCLSSLVCALNHLVLSSASTLHSLFSRRLTLFSLLFHSHLAILFSFFFSATSRHYLIFSLSLSLFPTLLSSPGSLIFSSPDSLLFTPLTCPHSLTLTLLS